jgi:hypothetical protein
LTFACTSVTDISVKEQTVDYSNLAQYTTEQLVTWVGVNIQFQNGVIPLSSESQEGRNKLEETYNSLLDPLFEELERRGLTKDDVVHATLHGLTLKQKLSGTLPRSINDYYANVTVRRQYSALESGEEFEVVVRIPQGLAKTLAGRQKPSILVPEVLLRVRSAANETAVLRTSAGVRVTLGLIIDATMPSSFPAEATFTDQDGVEVFPPAELACKTLFHRMALFGVQTDL